MSLTPEEYQEILDGEEWSPMMRAGLERQKSIAEKRDEQLARVSEAARKARLIRARQDDSLRELKRLLSECFEVAAWFRRASIPLIAGDASNRLLPKMRGMSARLRSARREAHDGCQLQSAWLDNHAEMIAEYERYRWDEQPCKFVRAAREPGT